MSPVKILCLISVGLNVSEIKWESHYPPPEIRVKPRTWMRKMLSIMHDSIHATVNIKALLVPLPILKTGNKTIWKLNNKQSIHTHQFRLNNVCSISKCDK